MKNKDKKKVSETGWMPFWWGSKFNRRLSSKRVRQYEKKELENEMLSEKEQSMETNVETKFNIGDAVYVVELYHEYYASKEPYTVVGIDIDITENATKIRYRLERDGESDSAIEDMLFATYEECTKWCGEHN